MLVIARSSGLSAGQQHSTTCRKPASSRNSCCLPIQPTSHFLASYLDILRDHGYTRTMASGMASVHHGTPPQQGTAAFHAPVMHPPQQQQHSPSTTPHCCPAPQASPLSW